jgi:hypothetical protein
MNKLIKFILIGVGALVGLFVLLLVVAAIAIPILLPPAKMKAMVTDKLSAAIHHKVSVGDVGFNVLSGFDVKNLVISNRSGWATQPLLNAKDISISYHLLPLLWGHVSLKEIILNQPDILVERRGLNAFNFSDMSGSETAQASPASAPVKAVAPAKGKAKANKKTKKHAELPVAPSENEAFCFPLMGQAWAETTQPTKTTAKSSLNVTVDGLNIIHGKMVYLDETVSPAQRYNLSDFNFHINNVSLVGGKTTFTLSTPFDYNKMTYQFSMGGSYRYFLSSQSIKELDLKGSVNDLGFKLSGDAQSMSDNFTPNMDGEASLDMLKFSGLVPRNLSAMPPGLSLTGSALVSFHLSGSMNSGLELSGTADGSDLAIQYQDVFAKTAKTTCKINFKSVKKANSFDIPSFSMIYQDWEVDGSFHYPDSAPWTCNIQSKDLPLKGVSDMVPRLKKVTFGGNVAINVAFAQSKGKATPFTYNGQVTLKDISITLPQEPYLEKLNSVIYLGGNNIRIPSANFQTFDGTGLAGVTLTMGVIPSYTYALRLTGVNSQKTIDASIDAYVTKKDFTTYKDKLYGTMNIAYAGYGRGVSGDLMMASQVGAGNYSLVNAKVKGLAAIKALNNAVKDPSDEINFEKIDGVLGMKNKVVSYTANTSEKVGAMRIKGGINADGAYTPDMTIDCDLHKDYVNSDAIKGQIPDAYRDKFSLDWAADDSGNIPADFKFTGPAADNHYQWVPDRLVNNVKKHAGQVLGQAAQQVIQNQGQNLGNALKGLFGH